MRSLSALIPALALSLTFGAAPLAAETTLRLAHTQPTSDTHHEASQLFVDRVAELTDGEVKITIHPAGELGNDAALLEGVRLGTVDMIQIGNPMFTRVMPKLNVLDLPFLFRDYAHVYAVTDGEIGQGLLADFEDHRMKGIAFWEIGFRKLTNSKHPVRTPADVQGLKIRTTANPAHVKAFELLGAIPTPMSFTELYLALETKAVDGQENPLNLINSSRFAEVQDYLSYTDHAYTVSELVMNLGKFNALTEEQQEAIMTAGKEAGDFQRNRNRENEADDLAAIKAAGVEVIQDIDREAFKAILFDAVTEAYAAEHGRDLIDAITNTK